MTTARFVREKTGNTVVDGDQVYRVVGSTVTDCPACGKLAVHALLKPHRQCCMLCYTIRSRE